MPYKVLSVSLISALFFGISHAGKKAHHLKKFPISGPSAIMSSYPSDVKENVAPPRSIHVSYYFPPRTNRGTGSTDSLSITENSLIKGYDGEVGWAKFDLSQGITSPPHHMYIWNITVHFYVNQTYWPWWCITHVTNDPLTTDPATLYNDIVEEYNNGTPYTWNYETSDFSPGWHSYELGGSANDDFVDALSAGWFGLGIVDFDFSTNYYIIIDGWAEEHPPYLEVKWSEELVPSCVTCDVFDQCGPFPTENWLADMAYDHTRGLIYQVSVDNGGSNIVIWNPSTCDYCLAYDYTTGISQRGIAYDPIDDVIYVGGWNTGNYPGGTIFKFQAPQCEEPLELLGTCDFSWSPLWSISGLAWDDDKGGLYVTNSSGNMLGKVNPNSCTLLYYGPITWMCLGQIENPVAGGLAYGEYALGMMGLFATVFDADNFQSVINYFFPPKTVGDLDPFGAETACVVESTYAAWGVCDYEDCGAVWFSDLNTNKNCHTYLPYIPTSISSLSENELRARGHLSVRPNPFAASTEITFSLSKKMVVKLSIYDASGRLIENLLERPLSEGTHTVIWNAEKLPRGVYFLKFYTEKSIVTEKLTLLQ